MQASRDENFVTTLLAVSNVDGETPVTLYADPVTHRLLTSPSGSGSGDVVGPASSTANAVARFDGITGKLLQNSNIVIADTGAITVAGAFTLPFVDGTANQVLQTDGAGVVSWASAGTGTVTSVSGTANRITSTGGATPVIDISASYVGQASITTLGTIGTGTWQGTAIADAYIASAATWNAKQSAITFGTGVQTALGVNVGTAGSVVVNGGALGTPSSGTLTSATGLPISTGVSGLGTNVATALGVNVGTAGAVVVNGGALGTPSSGTVTNLTGTASININGTVGATTPTTGVFTTATVNTGLLPDANDGAYLGQAGTAFSDLFLAEGGVINWDSGDATITQAGNLLTVAGAALILSDQVNGDGSALTTNATQTTSNKRPLPRTASSTTASTLTPDLSSANVYYRTTQTATLTIEAPIGTPVIGETIMIYVDSAGAQTLTINATYIPFGAAFPATTTAGKTFMMSAQYNGTNWKTLWANAV